MGQLEGKVALVTEEALVSGWRQLANSPQKVRRST
jgi:hypothetical protein